MGYSASVATTRSHSTKCWILNTILCQNQLLLRSQEGSNYHSLTCITNSYPLPKPVIATLSGGKQLSKFNLSCAYHQQLLLHDESAKLETINIHHGLFRYTWWGGICSRYFLSSAKTNYCYAHRREAMWKWSTSTMGYSGILGGGASAPGIFQKVMDTIVQVMDTILQVIPDMICYMNDILVTWSDKVEHFNIGQEKQVLQDSVEYIGHYADTRRLHTLHSKIIAMGCVPTPWDVQELRSGINMANSLWQPCNCSTVSCRTALLQKGQK